MKFKEIVTFKIPKEVVGDKKEDLILKAIKTEKDEYYILVTFEDLKRLEKEELVS